MLLGAFRPPKPDNRICCDTHWISQVIPSGWSGLQSDVLLHGVTEARQGHHLWSGGPCGLPLSRTSGAPLLARNTFAEACAAGVYPISPRGHWYFKLLGGFGGNPCRDHPAVSDRCA